MRRAALAPAAAFGALLGGVPQADAHAFGQRYDLPLPLDFYLVGGAAAVLLSFVIAARALPAAGAGRRWQLVLPSLPAPLGRALRAFLAALGLLLFLLVLVAGFFGADEPTGNIAPVLVWVLWWVGLLLLAALLGSLWPSLDPWSAGYRGVRRLFGRPSASAARSGSAWTAVALLFLFAWHELVS
jgi:hypothetical protein